MFYYFAGEKRHDANTVKCEDSIKPGGEDMGFSLYTSVCLNISKFYKVRNSYTIYKLKTTLTKQFKKKTSKQGN